MTEEELEVFKAKTRKLMNKDVFILDKKSKILIDRMNLQSKTYNENPVVKKQRKVASVFYPGV